MKLYKIVLLIAVLSSCTLINEDISYNNVNSILGDLEFQWYKSERISYGNNERDYYLYFAPENLESKELVFYVHGGGWKSGAPEESMYIAEYFNDLGYAVVLTAYPLIDQASIEEMNRAIVRSFKNARDRYAGTYESIIIGGASAGGQLAALLYAENKTEVQPLVSKMFLLSSVLDFNKCDNFVINGMIDTAFNSPSLKQNLNPVNKADSFKNLDFYIMYSKQDGIVNYENSISFGNTVLNSGAQVLYTEMINLYHDESYVFPFLYKYDELKDFEAWLKN